MQSGEDLSNQVVRNGGKSAFSMAFLAYNSNLKYLHTTEKIKQKSCSLRQCEVNVTKIGIKGMFKGYT